MTKRVLSLFLVAILIIGIVTGCSPKPTTKPTEGTNNNKGTDTVNEEIKITLESDIVSLDPQGHNDVRSEKISFLLFNRLFKLNADFEAVPDLAEEWSQPSKTEWVIKIKEGIKFQDGQEMTSEDVKYSMERSKKSAVVQHVLEQVEKVEIVDKYTVKITTKEAFAPFINTLVHAGVSIIPKHYDESNDNWAHPIGSGPYKFVSWTSGDKVVVERNDDYFDAKEKGVAKNIIFKVIPEGASRTIALETGEVDIVAVLEPMDVPKVQANSKLKVYDKPSTMFQYLGMNTQKPPFNNIKVRQAMNYAIDKEAVLQIVLEGAGVIATSVTSDSLLGHVPGNYTYNPDKAKELLKEAGQENMHIKLWAAGDQSKKIAEIAQGNLRDIGVTADIEMYEWGAFLDATNSGNQPMFVLGWDSNPDVDATLTPQFSKNSIGAQNRSMYSSEKVEKLLTEGRAELDGAKRKKIYQEIYTTLNEDAPWVPLYIENKIIGANSELKNVQLNSQGLIDLYKLHY